MREARTDPRWIRFRQLVGEHWRALQDECWQPFLSSRKCSKPRILAARYNQALKAWEPYFERARALDAEMEKFRAMADAAMARLSVTETDGK
jgi:hypothetical protein